MCQRTYAWLEAFLWVVSKAASRAFMPSAKLLHIMWYCRHNDKTLNVLSIVHWLVKAIS